MFRVYLCSQRRVGYPLFNSFDFGKNLSSRRYISNGEPTNDRREALPSKSGLWWSRAGWGIETRPGPPLRFPVFRVAVPRRSGVGGFLLKSKKLRTLLLLFVDQTHSVSPTQQETPTQQQKKERLSSFNCKQGVLFREEVDLSYPRRESPSGDS